MCERRDKFFKTGSRGLTVLSIIAASALLMKTKGCLQTIEWLWFLVLFALYMALGIYGGARLRKLDKEAGQQAGFNS